MPNIRILADSSCDLTDEQLSRHGITIVPLTIIIGETQYTDRVDIDSDRFFELIRDGRLTPSTSQPNFTQFSDAFLAADGEDTDILCFTMSSHGSGTYDSASLAARMLQEEGRLAGRVHIFDTRSASIGVGFFAEKAALLREEGLSAGAILDRLTGMRATFGSYFFADTLEYLKRGGRVSTVSASFGALLGIKPIISIIDGWGRSYAKVKGEQNALKELARIFAEKHRTDEVYITHAGNELGARLFLEEAERLCGPLRATVCKLGCVLATHAGPGAVGVFFEQSGPNSWPLRKFVPDEMREKLEKVEDRLDAVREKTASHVRDIAEKIKK